MHKTPAEAAALAKEILAGAAAVPQDRELILFPASVSAGAVADICVGSRVSVGMQNMYWEAEGAFTGEVSPLMVKAVGCRYVLAGHSERRHIFGEDDAAVNKKALAALANGISPILCVGELLQERESGVSNEVIVRQLKQGLSGVAAEDMRRIIIAYEPVWAIGTGKVATPEIAEEIHSLVRQTLAEIFGGEIAEAVPVLYGGSVKPENIAGLVSMPNIDGALVGGASLNAASFLSIAKVSIGK